MSVNLLACSTPTGIKGKGTPAYWSRPCGPLKCSTPTGIKGKGTRVGRSLQVTSNCAQRLQASKVKARESVPAVSKLMSVCSTPTGIKGKGTSERQLSQFGLCRAQRLQASKVKAPDTKLHSNKTVWCSTPTGIKGKGTCRFSPYRTGNNGCSTPTGIKGKGTPFSGIGYCRRYVLNAYRHQR